MTLLTSVNWKPLLITDELMIATVQKHPSIFLSLRESVCMFYFIIYGYRIITFAMIGYSFDKHKCAGIHYNWYPIMLPREQSSWGQHGAQLGPVGAWCAPWWTHELCYLGGSVTSRNSLNCWHQRSLSEQFISLQNGKKHDHIEAIGYRRRYTKRTELPHGSLTLQIMPILVNYFLWTPFCSQSILQKSIVCFRCCPYFIKFISIQRAPVIPQKFGKEVYIGYRQEEFLENMII